jgi:two-component system alkaline phosphatase synthesis response regulator PhoP
MAEKILVVDDEFTVGIFLKDFFTSLGYEVLIAADGEEALRLAEQEEPRVILLDAMMPGLDGLATCKLLKTQGKTKGIPIIMMTGFGITPAEAEMVEAEDLVFKPFNLPDLLKRVRAISKVGYLTNRVERLLAYMEELDRDHSGERKQPTESRNGGETFPGYDSLPA